MDDLVTTEWLAGEIGADDLSILDCSMFMTAMKRDAAAEYAAAHLPCAQFLDIEDVSDHADPAPHMLPGPAAFGAAMERLGVDRNDRIVVYDNSPLRSAARGWFMLRHFGASRVAILDGGLGKWLGEGRPVERGPSPPKRGKRFQAEVRDGEVLDKAAILAGADAPLVDARPRGRFEGSEPDPRPGVAAGHIPGAHNLPMGDLYQADGTFKSIADLRAALAAAGVDPSAPFVASCGSGVTANSLIFAARLIGGGGAKLYDGSWSEWGADPATPKAIGQA